jgi:N-acetylglucosamine-6-phosphate deacetylase
MIDMLKFVVNDCMIPLNEAWMMASLTPSKVVHVDAIKGSIEKNKDADILIIDEKLNIFNVYARGVLQ